MAGHARYTALIDACVLHSIAMTDALMSLATKGLFAAKWTAEIEGEWIRSVERARPDVQGKLGYRRDQMRIAMPDWEVDERAWRPLTTGIVVPDPKDAHVVAAAIAGHVDAIVTLNLKDFPDEILQGYGIDVIDPDTFIINQWDLDTATAIAAFKDMRGRRTKPSEDAEGFAAALERTGLPATAERLRSALELI
jgi:predicted nucleic acid-binding protein